MARTPARGVRPTKADTENPAWDDEEFRRARPAAEVLPASVVKAFGMRRRGPQIVPTKEAVSIRLDRDVLQTLRASGPGWQSRVNDTLRQALVLRDGRLADPAE